jgi:hypothetical protein
MKKRKPSVIRVVRPKPRTSPKVVAVAKRATPVPGEIVPDRKVRCVGDLRVPPFDGEFRNYDHLDWHCIMKPDCGITVGRWVVWRGKDHKVRFGRVWESDDRKAIAQVREFDAHNIQHLSRDYKVLKERLWVYTPFYDCGKTPNLIPQYKEFRRTGKITKHGAESMPLEAVREARVAYEERQRVLTAARKAAKEGDWWWIVYDGPVTQRDGTRMGGTMLGVFPGKTGKQAVIRARQIKADHIAAVRAKGLENVVLAARQGCTNEVAENTAAYCAGMRAELVSGSGRWNGDSCYPPIDGDAPEERVYMTPPAVIHAARMSVFEVKRAAMESAFRKGKLARPNLMPPAKPVGCKPTVQGAARRKLVARVRKQARQAGRSYQ